MIFSKANMGTFLTSLIIQGCGVMTGIVTARLLGPTARGELAAVMLWPVIFSNLGLMGCNWALARQVAADPGREADYVCDAAVVGMASAALYISAGYILIPDLLPADRNYLLPLSRLCLLLIPLDIFSQILLGIEHGQMRWKRYNRVRASYFIFYVISIGIIWSTKRVQVHWFVWAFLVSHLLAVLLRLGLQRKSFAEGRCHLSGCYGLLRRGWPYFCSTATNLLSLQLDKILVVTLMSTDAAGIYAVALTFGNAQSSLGEALGITSFAVLSSEKSARNQGELLTETFRHSALISAAFGLLLACLIPLLVKPLFGIEFSRAIRPAMVLALAATLTTSSDILNEGLRGAGRPYAGLASQLLGTIVLALGATILLPRFKLIGMAWAVVFSACAQVAVLVAAAANWLQISLLSFWPFSAKDIKIVFRQMAALRLQYYRSPA